MRSLLFLLLFTTLSPAQPKITTPREALGFSLGDDYQMATLIRSSKATGASWLLIRTA